MQITPAIGTIWLHTHWRSYSFRHEVLRKWLITERDTGSLDIKWDEKVLGTAHIAIGDNVHTPIGGKTKLKSTLRRSLESQPS